MNASKAVADPPARADLTSLVRECLAVTLGVSSEQVCLPESEPVLCAVVGDYCIDSLDVVECVLLLEEQLGVEIDPSVLQSPTLAAFVDILATSWHQ